MGAAPAGAPAGAPASAADAAAEVGSGEDEAQPYNQGVDECIYGNHPATLTDAAAANADFSTLVAALNASGLINAFDDISQKVTVFAPTNAAFDALFAATNTTAEQILGQTDFLQKVLKYHVVGDVMPYADLTDGATMPTLLEGASLGASTATSDSTVYSFGFPVGTTQTTAVTILGEASNATVVQGNVTRRNGSKFWGKRKVGGAGAGREIILMFSFLFLLYLQSDSLLGQPNPPKPLRRRSRSFNTHLIT